MDERCLMPSADDDANRVARARRLVRLFHRDGEGFGRFAAVDAKDVPEPFRGLLDHASHMTVVMERFYGGPVEVVVVAVRGGDGGSADGRAWYEREILLRSAAGQFVQYGIVRIDLGCVSPAVADRIRAAREPLGRILIAAGMLLEVQRVGLLGVDIGPEFEAIVELDPAMEPLQRRTFGRVAEIALDGAPAVELLEIVVPGPLPKVLR